MKINNNKNIGLLKACCTVEEIGHIQKNNEYLAKEFHKLNQYIETAENPNFEDLHNKFPDTYAINSFLDKMEKHNALANKISYYNKAVEKAKKHYASQPDQKFNQKLKEKFFGKNGIENLHLVSNAIPKKFTCTAACALTLVAATGGTLLLHSCATQQETKVVSTPTPAKTPEITSTPSVTSIDSLDINDENFSNKIIDDFKSLYANEYNQSKNANISPNDFNFFINENQNYIYQIKVGNEYRYVSHGNYPDNIKKYLENNNITPTIIEDCDAFSIYSTDENGENKKITDEFGNQSFEKLDSVVRIENPDTGNLELVKLYDGNNPQGLVNAKSNSKSVLQNLGNIVNVLSNHTNTEANRKIMKENYIKEVSNYLSEKTNLNDNVKEQLEH